MLAVRTAVPRGNVRARGWCAGIEGLGVGAERARTAHVAFVHPMARGHKLAGNREGSVCDGGVAGVGQHRGVDGAPHVRASDDADARSVVQVGILDAFL